MPAPTLRDVAEAAGVHAATASRALNPSTRGLVNADTARRVMKVAEQLGYRPNPIARGLKTAKSGTIGLVIPDLTNPLVPPMVTLHIQGGRKEKIRPGDVMGALTKDLGFAGAQIGKISVNEFSTYVAVERGIAQQALKKLNAGKVKGRSVKVRLLEG